jgi:hypothetical protein
MKIMLILSITIGITSFFQAQNDLSIKSFEAPEWEETTMMSITIKNSGLAISDTIWLKVSDADLTVDEAKKLKLYNDETKWIFDENESLEAEGNSDPYFEHFFPIVNLKKNETRKLNLNLGEYWPYDGNCELKMEIDCKQNLDETNENNNVEYFIAGG